MKGLVHVFVAVVAALLSAAQARAQAQAQDWVHRAQRPSSGRTLFPAAAPDGGPVLLGPGRDLLGWNGAGWRELTALPAGINGVFDMACDAARGRTVVFGITSFVPATVGTAEWDGQTWTTFPSFPSAAVGGSLVNLCYDPALGGVLALTQPLIGSTTQDHLWNGASWTPLTANVRPRHVGVSLAADPVRSRLVAFSTNPTTGLAETHEWDGTAWSLLSPVTSPPPRETPAMEFDPVAGNVCCLAVTRSPR